MDHDIVDGSIPLCCFKRNAWVFGDKLHSHNLYGVWKITIQQPHGIYCENHWLCVLLWYLLLLWYLQWICNLILGSCYFQLHCGYYKVGLQYMVLMIPTTVSLTLAMKALSGGSFPCGDSQGWELSRERLSLWVNCLFQEKSKNRSPVMHPLDDQKKCATWNFSELHGTMHRTVLLL